ncbi:comEC/Rec2-related domain protein [Asticcacaulis biprosthecium C19]|uniref:ComEC/Rec2-related domain protein n=2 Tax=Asticcacaulis biprosthecium TaxID=76891 RepID=F4QQN1_9CAUL|nr:comEC/Rec2-related domain protein [Asticcacaulis biprosthecium C19]
MPDGYDFARNAWFQGLGGVGFVPGRIEKIEAPPQGMRLKLMLALNRARWDLTETLVAQIKPGFKEGEALGGFAAAMVTGHEAYVPERLIEDMRDSGLAHILSISGVHMAVVGGFIFFFLRGAMAAMPPLALRIPVKKIAAAISIVCILVYLAISGAPAPAVRAAVVACVAFAAILFDRRALSLRALAIAALIVIALTPEVVIQPGFQMSFCATAALLALAETVKPDIREISVPLWVRAFQAALNGAKLSLVASFVATLATTPFAIAYFNRFSVYSLLSNLLEAPITAFVVMPCLALGTALAATPLGWIFLRIAGGGLWLIKEIAAWTSDLPYAVVTLSSAPGFVLAVATMGLIWVCLMRGKVRWAGLVVASSIVWWPRVAPPDIWIDPQGGNAAVRLADGAYVLRPKVRQFGFEQWTQHYGLRTLDEAARDRDYLCKGYGCVPLPSNPVKVGFWFGNKPPNDKRLAELCAASTLVVMRNPVGDWPATCSTVNRISAGDFRRLGAMELTRNEMGWAIKAAQPLRGNRYWSSPSEGDEF